MALSRRTLLAAAAAGLAACSKPVRHLTQRSSSTTTARAPAGAQWALGFTNPMAGPILVGKLGWEDVASLRVWVRPKRLRRTGRGALRATPTVGPFSDRRATAHEAHHIVRDAAYLTWRYADSPRPYVRIEDGEAGTAHDRSSSVLGFDPATMGPAVGIRSNARPASCSATPASLWALASSSIPCR